MIGIAHIACFLPSRTESNYDRKEDFGIDNAFIRDKLGVENVTRMADGEDTSDLACHATRKLLEETGCGIEQVDCLVVCTQNPDGGGIPHVSAIVHGRLGLPDSCACFDIGLGCSGYVYGLSVVIAFMQANGMRTGILVTADPYSKIVDRDDKNTVLLFGDAATATLLSEGAGWVPLRYEFSTQGAGRSALHVEAGRLKMTGRAVFSFSALTVPIQVNALLKACGLAADDIDVYFFHQGSRYIVETIASRLKLPAEKVPISMSAHGNTVSSSIPLMLATHIRNDGKQLFLLSGFGVGLSCASTVLKRTTHEENFSHEQKVG